jgi:hypothetical protein
LKALGSLKTTERLQHTQLTVAVIEVGHPGSIAQLFGSGFVEGAATYKLAGNTVNDTSTTAGPDVSFASVDNTVVTFFTEPVHGLGGVTVTTAGGISAPLAVNELAPGLGLLRDVAFDPASGQLWVIDNGTPAKIDRVDMTTGQVQQSITLTIAGFGTTVVSGGAGLQVVPAAMTLGSTTVPAGSLLLFNGTTSHDRVTAVNPVTGAVIATLVLGQDYNLSAGVYDPTSGHLFVLDRRTATTRIVEIDPVNAAEVSNFAAPFNAGEAGLAINLTTGNLWYGSGGSTNVAELTRTGMTFTGTVLRQVNLAPQHFSGGVSDLVFDASGRLLVASTEGRVHVAAV